MSERAYRAIDPSRARAYEAPLRERLIDAGLLRPRRYDGLLPIQLPPGMSVLRLDERTRLRAEADARS